MSGCWNSTRPKRSSTKGKRASAGRSRRLKHSCIGTSATRTKAIDMTDDPGERQGDILSRHAATPRPPSQEFPMPTVFSHPAPVLALAALLGGRVSTRMLLFGILCAVLPDADVIGFRFGISYADAFWPFDQTRYFCDWRPIRVSPFGLKGLLSQRGLSVMLSELRWVWAPCLAVIAAALFFGKNPMRAIPRK